VTFDVVIEVAPQGGIADPQGATIERALPALGFGGVRDVRVGKAIRFTLDAADAQEAHALVTEMCDRFLTNPVIETSEVRVEHRP
jgi:phosphoribosylformylglycinamidine synthase subunit PurS